LVGPGACGSEGTAITAGTRLAELHLRTGATDKALTVAKEVLWRERRKTLRYWPGRAGSWPRVTPVSARQTLGRHGALTPTMIPWPSFAVARLQVAAGNDSGAAYSLDKALGTQPDLLAGAGVCVPRFEIRQREFTKAEQRIKRIGEKSGGGAVALRLQGDLAMARGQQAVALTGVWQRAKKEDNTIWLCAYTGLMLLPATWRRVWRFSRQVAEGPSGQFPGPAHHRRCQPAVGQSHRRPYRLRKDP